MKSIYCFLLYHLSSLQIIHAGLTFWVPVLSYDGHSMNTIAIGVDQVVPALVYYYLDWTLKLLMKLEYYTGALFWMSGCLKIYCCKVWFDLIDPDEPQKKVWNIPLWFEISSQVTDEAADEQTIKKFSPITSKVHDLVVKLTEETIKVQKGHHSQHKSDVVKIRIDWRAFFKLHNFLINLYALIQ